MDTSKIRSMIEWELDNRKFERMRQMLKSMTDQELLEYRKRMEQIK